MKVPTPKAILFDLDGTLLDSLPGIQFSAQEAVGSLWPGRSLPDLMPHIGPPIGEVLQRALPDASAAQIQYLVQAFRRSYDTTGWPRSTLYDGTAGLLATLRSHGVRSFVASNKPALVAERILQHLRIQKEFAAISCRDSRNPAYGSKAELVRCLLEDNDLSPERTWLVGDCPDDRHAAQSNRIRFILAGYGYGSFSAETTGCGEAQLSAPDDLLCLLQRTTDWR